MRKNQARTSRRRFLKTGTVGAFALLSGRTLFANIIGSQTLNKKNLTTGRDTYKVFSEGQIGSLILKNRLIRSAAFMGMSPGGALSEQGVVTYNAYAEGGVGLIISGNMLIMKTIKDAVGRNINPINNDSFIPQIRKMANAVHQVGNGCKVIAQINHVGMQENIEHPVSPSGIWLSLFPNPGKEFHILSTRETEMIVKDFVDAAERVQKAGFDGVEIHCAHGYLLSSFLSPYANRRTDKYGGSIGKRVTIVREIVTGIRERTGKDFPILVKMNCNDNFEGGININSFPALAKEVAKTGVDAIEISGNNPFRMNPGDLGNEVSSDNPIKVDLDRVDDQSYFYKHVKKLNLDIPIILTGGNKSIEHIEKISHEGKVDFFGFARPLIAESDLPNRWLKGIGNEECKCISCSQCFFQLFEGKAALCQVLM
jgi:2,4-dienoyl-CoA reductase-like NADH-dependent reductase (Old Yellow Enzyme family)